MGRSRKNFVKKINERVAYFVSPSIDYQLAYVLYQKGEFKRAKNKINAYLKSDSSNKDAIELKRLIEEKLRAEG